MPDSVNFLKANDPPPRDHNGPPGGPLPLAFSYIRFSRPEMIRGDSLSRQKRNSAAYAAEMGLRLVTDYRDLGVSAKAGRNRTEGALGDFLAAVERGAVPARSHLLVESLDRLSREHPLDALQEFIAILKMGLAVHTLMDRQVYSWESVRANPMQLFGSIMVMVRAHEENETKGKRVAENKAKAREAAAKDGTVMTAMAPAWLELHVVDGVRKFRAIPERERVVKRILQMTADGIGAESIVRILNAEGVPSFGDERVGKRENGWHKWYVRRIIAGRAVCGDYEPRDGRPTIPGYFPRVADEELWERARAARLSRTRTGGPKGSGFNNLFSGVACCAECGGGVSVKSKGVPAKGGGRERRYYLVCDGHRRARGCGNGRHLDYAPVERAVLDRVWQVSLDPDSMVGNREEVRAVENDMADLASRAEHLQGRIDAFAAGDAPITPALMLSLKKMEEEKDAALARRGELALRLVALRAAVPPQDHLEAIRLLRDAALEGDFEARARINQGLREVTDCVVFAPPKTVLVMMAGRRIGFEFRDGELVRSWDWPWGEMPAQWGAWLAKVPRDDGTYAKKWRWSRRKHALPPEDQKAFLGMK